MSTMSAGEAEANNLVDYPFLETQKKPADSDECFASHSTSDGGPITSTTENGESYPSYVACVADVVDAAADVDAALVEATAIACGVAKVVKPRLKGRRRRERLLLRDLTVMSWRSVA